MNKVIQAIRTEVSRIEDDLKKIDIFLHDAPEGCLKYQTKDGKTYYYHQFWDGSKWKRKYIKKSEVLIAKLLAQKQYYGAIRPILKRNLSELNRVLQKCPRDEAEEIYDNLSDERKELVVPIQMSAKEKIKQWQSEIYEKNMSYPEKLRYETEQGDMVRSKSEVIIANILYQKRQSILYKYERPLEVVENGHIKTIYPDFTIINKYTGRVMYWEHAGRMDDPYYANDFVRKVNTYVSNNLIPGRDVIMTYETQNNSLDIKVVKRLVQQVVSEKF